MPARNQIELPHLGLPDWKISQSKQQQGRSSSIRRRELEQRHASASGNRRSGTPTNHNERREQRHESSYNNRHKTSSSRDRKRQGERDRAANRKSHDYEPSPTTRQRHAQPQHEIEFSKEGVEAERPLFSFPWNWSGTPKEQQQQQQHANHHPDSKAINQAKNNRGRLHHDYNNHGKTTQQQKTCSDSEDRDKKGVPSVIFAIQDDDEPSRSSPTNTFDESHDKAMKRYRSQLQKQQQQQQKRQSKLMSSKHRPHQHKSHHHNKLPDPPDLPEELRPIAPPPQVPVMLGQQDDPILCSGSLVGRYARSPPGEKKMKPPDTRRKLMRQTMDNLTALESISTYDLEQRYKAKEVRKILAAGRDSIALPRLSPYKYGNIDHKSGPPARIGNHIVYNLSGQGSDGLRGTLPIATSYSQSLEKMKSNLRQKQSMLTQTVTELKMKQKLKEEALTADRLRLISDRRPETAPLLKNEGYISNIFTDIASKLAKKPEERLKRARASHPDKDPYIPKASSILHAQQQAEKLAQKELAKKNKLKDEVFRIPKSGDSPKKNDPPVLSDFKMPIDLIDMDETSQGIGYRHLAHISGSHREKARRPLLRSKERPPHEETNRPPSRSRQLAYRPNGRNNMEGPPSKSLSRSTQDVYRPIRHPSRTTQDQQNAYQPNGHSNMERPPSRSTQDVYRTIGVSRSPSRTTQDHTSLLNNPPSIPRQMTTQEPAQVLKKSYHNGHFDGLFCNVAAPLTEQLEGLVSPPAQGTQSLYLPNIQSRGRGTPVSTAKLPFRPSSRAPPSENKQSRYPSTEDTIDEPNYNGKSRYPSMQGLIGVSAQAASERLRHVIDVTSHVSKQSRSSNTETMIHHKDVIDVTSLASSILSSTTIKKVICVEEDSQGAIRARRKLAAMPKHSHHNHRSRSPPQRRFQQRNHDWSYWHTIKEDTEHYGSRPLFDMDQTEEQAEETEIVFEPSEDVNRSLFDGIWDIEVPHFRPGNKSSIAQSKTSAVSKTTGDRPVDQPSYTSENDRPVGPPISTLELKGPAHLSLDKQGPIHMSRYSQDAYNHKRHASAEVEADNEPKPGTDSGPRPGPGPPPVEVPAKMPSDLNGFLPRTLQPATQSGLVQARDPTVLPWAQRALVTRRDAPIKAVQPREPEGTTSALAQRKSPRKPKDCEEGEVDYDDGGGGGDEEDEEDDCDEDTFQTPEEPYKFPTRRPSSFARNRNSSERSVETRSVTFQNVETYQDKTVPNFICTDLNSNATDHVSRLTKTVRRHEHPWDRDSSSPASSRIAFHDLTTRNPAGGGQLDIMQQARDRRPESQSDDATGDGSTTRLRSMYDVLDATRPQHVIILDDQASQQYEVFPASIDLRHFGNSTGRRWSEFTGSVCDSIQSIGKHWDHLDVGGPIQKPDHPKVGKGTSVSSKSKKKGDGREKKRDIVAQGIFDFLCF